MPEPVSTLAISLAGYAMLSAYARGGNAISDEARAAQDAASAVIQSVERSQALFGPKAAAISRLRSLANECSQEGWDGDDASAMDPIAVFRAEELVRALPDDLPLPEFAPEPDGAVSLDWSQARARQFSISVGRSNRLAYAWLDGTDRGHAVARFDGTTVPPRVLGGIRAIMNHGNASLRAA